MSNQWNAFRSQYKGSGLSVSEVAALYRQSNPNIRSANPRSRCAGLDGARCASKAGCKTVRVTKGARAGSTYCRTTKQRGRPTACKGLTTDQCATLEGCSMRKASSYTNKNGKVVARGAYCAGTGAGKRRNRRSKSPARRPRSKATGALAQQMSGRCAALDKNACRNDDACNWQGGKWNRCVRGSGKTALAAMQGRAAARQNLAAAAAAGRTGLRRTARPAAAAPAAPARRPRAPRRGRGTAAGVMDAYERMGM